MLSPTTLKFLKDLKNNNEKTWFNAHRNSYELARLDIHQLIEKILSTLSIKDTNLQHLLAKDCIFRIHKDARFSKNAPPYKTNFGASLTKGGKKSGFAGYYLHIEPGKSFVGGGLYMPIADTLKKVRQEIDYHTEEFKKTIEANPFKKIYKHLDTQAFSLSTVPKGYNKHQAGIEYIKLKSFVAAKPLTDKDITSPTLFKTIIQSFKALTPMITFLNRAINT